MMASHHGGSDGQRERMDGGGHGGGQGHMNGANSGGGIVSHAGVQRVHAGLAGMRIGQPAAHGQQQQPPRVPPMSSGVGPDAYGRGGGVYGGDHGRNSGYDMWSHGAVVNSAPGPPRSTASQHYMIASSMPSGIGGHSTSTASHAQSYSLSADPYAGDSYPLHSASMVGPSSDSHSSGGGAAVATSPLAADGHSRSDSFSAPATPTAYQLRLEAKVDRLTAEVLQLRQLLLSGTVMLAPGKQMHHESAPHVMVTAPVHQSHHGHAPMGGHVVAHHGGGGQMMGGHGSHGHGSQGGGHSTSDKIDARRRRYPGFRGVPICACCNKSFCLIFNSPGGKCKRGDQCEHAHHYMPPNAPTGSIVRPLAMPASFK